MKKGEYQEYKKESREEQKQNENDKRTEPKVVIEERKVYAPVEEKVEAKELKDLKVKYQELKNDFKEKIARKLSEAKVPSTMQDFMDSNYYFLRLIIRFKYHFLVVTGAAILLSAVFSMEFFIKPKYKSMAVVYPSNIIPYSSESQSEQMLQLFESADIRDHVMRKFNLSAHYGIDTAAQSGFSDLISEYESNIEVNRTQYESIEIIVLDTDPKLAVEIVNEIITALNLKARTLQREKTKEIAVMLSNQLVVKKRQVDSLNSILEELRVKYQILDYESQSKEVTKSYLKALSAGKSKESLKDIDVLKRNLEEKGGEYYETNRTFDAVLGSYNSTQLEFDNTMKDLNKELTYTNVVTKPFPADKKSYPIRWLIVLLSVASANLFLFVVLMIRESRKKITE